MINEILQSNQTIFLTALLLISSVLVTKFSSRLGVPSLVLFIIVGMVVGSDGLNFIYFDNAGMAQLVGTFALIVILFEGGLETKWDTIRPVVRPALSLATVGVVITSGIVGVASKFIFDVTWLEGFLFGSIVGSTDAAAVFAVLKGKNVHSRLEATLEAESGSNDPMAVFLTLAFIQLINSPGQGVLAIIGSFFWQMGFGLVVGLLIGKIGSMAINRINLDSGGLYPIFALSFALLTYGVSSLTQASGLLAVYVAALVIGNSELTYRHSILRFNEGFTWMMQILMFVILGLLVFPSQLFQWDIIIEGLLISIVLILVARPIAVYLSLMGGPFGQKERLFLSWAGLRGAVPIVLAIYPSLAELENSQLFFNVVFFVVLTSTLIQGSTITPLARKLKLVSDDVLNPIHSLELISIGKTNVEMIEYTVTDNNTIKEQTLEELHFPDGVLVNAIIRDGDILTPYGQTSILPGDTLYIMVPKKNKRQLQKILNDELVKTKI
ncbi:potassium transporter CPA [Pontibacillus halophilus JSM 076056 = DSM 19796]|uniref:Potassium transporter CPA n=1 Tax=Pontibacillus halophilus JSM 076056 = DSM 19796 TaxID=1385510 RepID=A0A0A5GPU3_9BACI|nr:potassium/proton antiporter [Pontibacillus halophilus]KGX93984.1 potassium transporter CPA [Pontibacillus halophilus JSM 076056 = DSM 19796]